MGVLSMITKLNSTQNRLSDSEFSYVPESSLHNRESVLWDIPCGFAADQVVAVTVPLHISQAEALEAFCQEHGDCGVDSSQVIQALVVRFLKGGAK